MVLLANFYDALIDCPTAIELIKELFAEWGKNSLLKKEAEEQCIKHVESVKSSLEAEYKKKA